MEKRGKNLTKEELKAMPLEELKQLVKKLHKRNWERNQGKDYVFISYSHADKEAKLVYELVAWFLQKGVSLSIDTEYSGESESWVRLMKGRLEDVNCKAMMAFYSENYVQSYPALMEFLYRYSIGVRMGRGKRKMPLIPVDLDQEGYIRKKVDELSHRSPELLKEDPNGEEIKCVEDGLEGLKNLDKNNEAWYKGLAAKVVNNIGKTKQDVALCMSIVIENQEPQFDNCNRISDDWNDLLNILKKHRVLVNEEVSEEAAGDDRFEAVEAPQKAAETASAVQAVSTVQAGPECAAVFRQPIEEFKKTFEAALAANKQETRQRDGENKKTPPICFKSICLELPWRDEVVTVTGNKWKPLLGKMLDAIYEKQGKDFFETCAAEAARSGNAEPYVITNEDFKVKISPGNWKHYQCLKSGDFWFRNWFSAELLVHEAIKWIKRYQDYLGDRRIPYYELDQYFVEYEPEAQFVRYFKSAK